MKLLSVNIASAKPITVADRSFETGIFKQATQHPVFVAKEGLEGDSVCDKKHHGGPDQAVYLYSNEDYAFWAEQLGYHPEAGAFGENLTLSKFDTDTIKIGDRITIGEVILEVTAPRIPCATFAKKMEDVGFVKKFREARRPGVYVRVIQTGDVTAGDSASYEATQQDTPSLVELFDLYYEKDLSKEKLEYLLAAPIDVRSRNHYQELLNEMP